MEKKLFWLYVGNVSAALVVGEIWRRKYNKLLNAVLALDPEGKIK